MDTSCYRRLGEVGPPRIFAQVVAQDHRITDCSVQTRSLTESLLRTIEVYGQL